MLFFSKKKQTLKDLIPDNHIDIHSHLLPGIDDGARNFEETVLMIKALQKLGITDFITTPHIIQHVWENTHEQIQTNRDQTVRDLEQQQIQLPFKAAAEYLMDDQFVKLFESHDLLTLKDNYVLVEMSYINAPIQLYSILFDLQVAGYIPVLAHPERYLFYHKNPEEFKKLKKAGCKFQLNLLAVTGYYGKEVAAVAETLLKNGQYDFVGTDAHHLKHIAAMEQKVKIKDLIPLQEIIANNQFFKQY
ncbi:tyrosine-protein phosphatase [Flavobacterium sp. UMI-01]|uniref:tyrosine-protein phosphatase n=1 Tax=Flavobacterium sp. UMI-01 TaxID=1441053 RepID=UPI001C7CAA95|nr:CpsB/CapC family capsule biosynthesis tyrosine phosphatase [Flavobacterium sp. UMI-01]GIZ07444.1 capsular polysaccharide biosynthesis protein [Flavobacterium sp. UMI-01]